mmetsp:Transcript_9674/g.28964  ORF Transcript_9674/g.28964 Transcript_9674/m.28964 type:complete len:235 (+) Transcript_9674:264-968(+)
MFINVNSKRHKCTLLSSVNRYLRLSSLQRLLSSSISSRFQHVNRRDNSQRDNGRVVASRVAAVAFHRRAPGSAQYLPGLDPDPQGHLVSLGITLGHTRPLFAPALDGLGQRMSIVIVRPHQLVNRDHPARLPQGVSLPRAEHVPQLQEGFVLAPQPFRRQETIPRSAGAGESQLGEVKFRFILLDGFSLGDSTGANAVDAIEDRVFAVRSGDESARVGGLGGSGGPLPCAAAAA